MAGEFVVFGALDLVAKCDCTPEALTEVPVRGWGVGAGGFDADATAAVRHIGDATFLFSTGFVSLLPGTPQRTNDENILRASGCSYYAAIMARFGGVAPDYLDGPQPVTTQKVFLDSLVRRAPHAARAVGCVSLVKINRKDIAGALIATPVASGHTVLPDGKTIVDPDMRDRYFDVDPIRHHRGFVSGFGWLVAASVRIHPYDPTWIELTNRFGGPARASDGWLHHCHIVLVGEAPSAWHVFNASLDWDVLQRQAERSVSASADSAFAFHSDGESIFEPQATATWHFSEQQIHLS